MLRRRGLILFESIIATHLPASQHGEVIERVGKLWKSIDQELIIRKEVNMTKKETLKWIVQLVASIASAILTVLGATSCMGY